MDTSPRQDSAGGVPEKYRSSVFQLGGEGESPAKAAEQYMGNGNGNGYHHNGNGHTNGHVVESAPAGLMKCKEKMYNPITGQAIDEVDSVMPVTNGKSEEAAVTISSDKTPAVNEKLPPAGRSYFAGRAGRVPPGGFSTLTLG